MYISHTWLEVNKAKYCPYIIFLTFLKTRYYFEKPRYALYESLWQKRMYVCVHWNYVDERPKAKLEQAEIVLVCIGIPHIHCRKY